MSQAIKLDDKDKQILCILQNNAKASLRDIEKEINLTTTSIRLRIKRLQEQKVIKKYLTLIDCQQLGYREMVMISLRVNSTYPIIEIKKTIENMDKVSHAYVITGEYSLFVMAKCLNHSDSMILIEELRKHPGVEEVKTQIVLDKIKEDPSVIIPE